MCVCKAAKNDMSRRAFVSQSISSISSHVIKQVIDRHAWHANICETTSCTFTSLGDLELGDFAGLDGLAC